ncbi:hypothetical protein ACFV5E_42715 [Streptomyces chartreusis]|uniref:hypothetical protein n=1 Tax=Streptomyces chartreusis TaxID=1969 RepID=UPI00368C754B
MPEEMCQGNAPQGRPRTDQHHEELSSASLQNLEHTLAGHAQDNARRLASRTADARLVDILRADNFQGPRFEKAITPLMEYGWLTINKWTGTGEIFEHSRRVGRPVPEHMILRNWDADARSEVATDTVIAGLGLFHQHGLIRGKWKPDGGASLTTYFVGACVRSFSAVYLHWSRSAQTTQAELVLPSTDADGLLRDRDLPDPHAVDPYYAAATHDQVERILPSIKGTKLGKGLALRALGYTQRHAATLVGLTEKALEGRTGRFRSHSLPNLAGKPDPEEGEAR